MKGFPMRNINIALSLSSFVLMLALLATPTTALAHEHTAISADGEEINYLLEGNGETALIFVHGWCCDLTYWYDQMTHFYPDYTVICIDLAGHGKSGLMRDDYTMAAFGADVNAVIKKEKIDNYVLIGHSMGGAVITEAALASPKGVRGLVGVDNFQTVSFGLTDEQIEGYASHFQADFPGNVKPWVKEMFTAESDSALAENISHDMSMNSPEVGVSAMKNLLTWYNTQTSQALPKLPAPLMCINSETRPTDVEALKALCPDYKLRLMKGGHFIAQEDPATFNALLEETLADLLK